MLRLDQYERKARLIPGLFALLPIPILLMTLGFRDYPLIVGVGSLIAGVGGPAILAGFVRQKGQEVERKLFRAWGGPPTTKKLRLGGSEDSTPLLKRRRRAIELLLTIDLPSSSKERSFPSESDSIYEAATRELRAMTCDAKSFPLLQAENRNYGLERNLLAMKNIALSLSFLIALAIVVLMAVGWQPERSADLTFGGLACLALGVFWLTFPTEARVLNAADTYAESLLDTVSAFKKPVKDVSP